VTNATKQAKIPNLALTHEKDHEFEYNIKDQYISISHHADFG